MTLIEVWESLLEDPAAAMGWGRRRVHGDSPIDLNATLSSGQVRGLALTVPDGAAPQEDDLPESRAIEHSRRRLQDTGRTVLELRLVDPDALEVFGALADDVAAHAAAAGSDEEAVTRWIGRVARWQRLLASGSRGLSPERQLGLYAELSVLRGHVSDRLGLAAAVDGWTGPAGGHDFQLQGGAFEVKGSASHEPQTVTINSERQLDETGTDGLHLIHLSLDVHRHAGETLPEIVADLRTRTLGTPAEFGFAERLLDAGYADVHEPRYRTVGYTLREEHFFKVRDGFPRLVEADLPDGVGGLTYRLVIAACMPFVCAPNTALMSLSAGGGGAHG